MNAVRERIAHVFRLTRHYRFQSLLVRNAVIAFVLVLIPLLVVGLTAYRNIDRSVRSSLDELNAATSLRIRDTIDAAIRDTNRIAASLILEHDVWSFFRGIWPDFRAYELFAEVRRLTTRFAHVYPYIDSIYAYSELNEVVVAAHGALPVGRFDDTGWMGAYAARDNSELHLVSRRKFGVYPHLISAVRREVTTGGRSLGALIVNIDVELLARIISESEPEMIQDTYVIGDDGVILLHRDQRLVGVAISDLPFFDGMALDHPDRTVSLRYEGRDYTVSWARSTYGPLTYVVALPLNAQIERLASARTYLLTSIVVAVAAAAVIAFLVSIHSYEPVSEVVRMLSDPDRQPVPPRRSGEVRYIAEQLTTVIHSNRDLKAEIESRLGLLHSAQISALQAQINPHFLYNALEGINWLAIRAAGEENEISRAVTDLSDLLRYSLGSDHQMARLADEIEHARAYLAIMRIRYPNRWTERWSIDPAAERCAVPRMILQPILENAIQHGIVPVKRAGVITVSARCTADTMVIEVADNGAGLSRSMLERLSTELSGPADIQANHIGLRNVNHRIRLLYTNRFGVRIAANRGPGITIRIALPAVLEQDRPPL